MMRMLIGAVALTLISAVSASAIEFQTPVTKQLYTCAMPGLSRVAMQAGPAPCCDGQLKCAQLLSTSGTLLTRRDPRT